MTAKLNRSEYTEAMKSYLMKDDGPVQKAMRQVVARQKKYPGAYEALIVEDAGARVKLEKFLHDIAPDYPLTHFILVQSRDRFC